MSSLDCAPMAPSSSARWRSTRTFIGSVTSVAPRGSSWGWPRGFADASCSRLDAARAGPPLHSLRPSPAVANSAEHMRYLALACDYDGTLAHHGQLDPRTREALERVRQSGRRVLLVTGRDLDDL